MPPSASDAPREEGAGKSKCLTPARAIHVCRNAARYYEAQAMAATNATEAQSWQEAAQQAHAAQAVCQAVLSIAQQRLVQQLRAADLPAFAHAIETGDVDEALGLPPGIVSQD